MNQLLEKYMKLKINAKYLILVILFQNNMIFYLEHLMEWLIMMKNYNQVVD